MIKARLVLTFAALGLLAGCNFFPCDFGFPFLTPSDTQSVKAVTPDDLPDPNTPAKGSPAADADPIRLRLSNPSSRDADCRVTMELVGSEVHFSLRRIIAATNSLVIGPDRADIIRIEATFLGDPVAQMAPQILRLNQDFKPGDTIDFALIPPPDDSQQDIPDDQNDDTGPTPPPPAPTITIEGLNESVIVTTGEIVAFDVVTTDAPAEGLVSIYADSNDPNDTPVAVAVDLPAAATIGVEWNTTNVPPGTYVIRAELRAGADLYSAEPPIGRVIIEPLPLSLGACCYPDQTCELLTEEECLLGNWLGLDTTCDDCPDCLVICPPEQSRLENEPCGEDMNSGCMDPCMPSFEPIACGETVCGTAWLDEFDPNEPNYPYDGGQEGGEPNTPYDPNDPFLDIDWYEFTIDDDAEITCTVRAEFSVFAGLIEQFDLGVPGCENLIGLIRDPQLGAACQTLTFSRCLPQGTYYLVLMPFYLDSPPVSCGEGNDYTITLDCVPCNYYAGACCFDEYCELMNETDCEWYDGEYQGDGSTCEPNNPCLDPLGACCYPDGDCDYISEEYCQFYGGDSWDEGVYCEPNPCPQPLGSCCYPDGDCDFITEDDCFYDGGDFWDEGVGCDPNPCPQPMGACCYEDGDCDFITEDDCQSYGGDFWDEGETCDPNPCPQPMGACCFPDGDCDYLTEDDCQSYGGDFWGEGETCEPNPCPQPTGACCFYTDCQIMTEGECGSSEGYYQGDFTTCDPNPCLPPIGACCYEDGYCKVMEEFDCLLDGGDFQGDGVPCDPNPCPQPPTGACCIDGVCSIMTDDECISYQGEYQGDGTTCEPNPCAGACCYSDGACTVESEIECSVNLGIYWGDGTTCDPNPCPQLPTGACCLNGSTCDIMSEPNCISWGGVYVGDDVTCDDPNICIPGPGDNCDNLITLDTTFDIPYSDLGQTTCGRLDYHNETCMIDYDEGEEIVYQIWVKFPMEVEFMLDPKGTPFTAMSLSQICPPAEPCTTVADDTGAGAPITIPCSILDGGMYTLMIDLSETGGDCIPDFDLVINICGMP